MKDRLIKVRDVARTFDCSPKTVLAHIKAGRLPAVRLGKRWYYVLESDVRNFIAKSGDKVLRERLEREGGV